MSLERPNDIPGATPSETVPLTKARATAPKFVRRRSHSNQAVFPEERH